jgi:uncharacterized membrane protein YfcA
MLTSIDPLYSLTGFLVGLLVGQTGMGGGAMMTPLLMLLFGINPATAVGTDLLYASATKTVDTLVHGLNHTVRWRIVTLFAMGSVPASGSSSYVGPTLCRQWHHSVGWFSSADAASGFVSRKSVADF